MKALVIDDDTVARMAAEKLLNQLDALEIVTAEDGEAGWQHLAQGLRPVICCCDVNMPRLSGIELLKRVKKTPETANIPFVLVSSLSNREVVAQAIRLGVAGYILKPLHANDGAARLEAILRNVRDRCAESPTATLERLNIPASRLVAYLTTLDHQLSTAAAETSTLLQQGKWQEVSILIDRLHTGCTTLGLWRGANALKAITVDQLQARTVSTVFSEAVETVAYQTRRLKRL